MIPGHDSGNTLTTLSQEGGGRKSDLNVHVETTGDLFRAVYESLTLALRMGGGVIKVEERGGDTHSIIIRGLRRSVCDLALTWIANNEDNDGVSGSIGFGRDPASQIVFGKGEFAAKKMASRKMGQPTKLVA